MKYSEIYAELLNVSDWREYLEQKVKDELFHDTFGGSSVVVAKQSVVRKSELSVSSQEKKRLYARRFNAARKHIEVMQERGIKLNEEAQKQIKSAYQENDWTEFKEEYLSVVDSPKQEKVSQPKKEKKVDEVKEEIVDDESIEISLE